MTTLLEKAFKEASMLPEVGQNALAKWVIEELHSESKWQKKFGETENILEKLANEAIEDKRNGKTTPLDQNLHCALRA